MLVSLPILALFAVAAAALAALAVHYRRKWQAARAAGADQSRRADAVEARLGSAPVGCLALSAIGGGYEGSPALREALGLGRAGPVAPESLLGAFDEAGARELSTALGGLRRDGAAFKLRLESKQGGVFEINGGRARPAGGGSGVAVGADLVWLHDVTEIARALAEAEAGRESVHGLLDALPVPIWRRDKSLALVYCNRAYAEAVDRPREAALSEAAELLGRTKSKSGRAVAARALESGQLESERHHVVVGGARRLLEVTERPAGDGTLVGHAVDRTDAEEFEAELKRHIAAHGEVLENLGSAIAIFGPDLKLRFFNASYARLWQLDEAFLETEPGLGDVLEALRDLRRLPEQANFPEYKREWTGKLKRLIDPIEELLHLPDGSTLRSVASPHPFGGVLLTYEDVTDRLSLESSYNTLIEVQRETLNNLYEGVAVYGADGRLKLSNPAFARIWDLAPERLTGEPHVRDLIEETRAFFQVSDADWTQILETRVARATEPEPRKGRRERADGSIIDWALVPLPDGASLFTFLDVTDSTRVERALRERAEALETADRLKSEFIASVSYELRTPLTAIVGFAEVLEQERFGELNQRQLEYSHGIVEASQQLMRLINDILDLAVIEAGYLELDLGQVNVHDLLGSIHTLGHERAHSRGIDLKIDCPVEVGSLIADERRLKQALFNLLSNAFKFTPEGGAVTVAAERGPEDMLLTVSDTGTGIREEDLERVFGKFERAGARSASQGGQGGAGFGLSLVKSLIELHGGRVELESEPDRGTRVICRIPLDAAKATVDRNETPLSA